MRNNNNIHVLGACALTVLLSVSCLDVRDDVPTCGASPVAFVPRGAAPTKAAIDGTSFPASRTLRIAAYYNAVRGDSGTYFAAVPFGKAGDTWMATDTARWWPFAGTLDFLMYSADGLSLTPRYDTKITDGVTLVVADNGAVQCDILHASLARQRRVDGGNPVTLRHAQALVTFTATSNVAYDAARNLGVTLDRVTLTGTSFGGTLHVSAAADPDDGWCFWSALAAPCDKDLPSVTGGPLALPYIVPTEPLDISLAGNHMGVGGIGILVPEQPSTGMVFEYTLHNGIDDAGNRIDNHLSHEYACDGTPWLEGRRYVYAVAFTFDQIEVVPYVLDWDVTVVATGGD